MRAAIGVAAGVAAGEAHVDELRDKKNEDLEAHQSQAVDITPSDSLGRLGDDAGLAPTQWSCSLIERRSKAKRKRKRNRKRKSPTWIDDANTSTRSAMWRRGSEDDALLV